MKNAVPDTIKFCLEIEELNITGRQSRPLYSATGRIIQLSMLFVPNIPAQITH